MALLRQQLEEFGFPVVWFRIWYVVAHLDPLQYAPAAKYPAGQVPVRGTAIGVAAFAARHCPPLAT